MAIFNPNRPQGGQAPNIPNGIAGPVTPEGDDLDEALRQLGLSPEEMQRLQQKQARLNAQRAQGVGQHELGQVGDGNVFFDPAPAIRNVIEKRRFSKDEKALDEETRGQQGKTAEARRRVAEALPGLSSEAQERILASVNDEGTLRALAASRARKADEAGTAREDKLRADERTQHEADVASDRSYRESQTRSEHEYESGERAKDRTYKAGVSAAAGTKPPPGYTWTPDGNLQAIPGGPGDKLPESQQKAVIGAQNLANGIDDYRKQLKQWSNYDLMSPDARAAMVTKYKNVMLQAKDAYGLGVLNGPDLGILESVLTDPTSLRGAVTSNASLDKQAAELDRIMAKIALVSGNRRPQDGDPTRREQLSESYDNANKPATKTVSWSDLPQ